jgi:S1-C subfamily serine protease/thioredoxin-related protein
MSSIRCFCPSCGVRLSTSGDFATGETIDCPKCGATFAPPQLNVASAEEWDEEVEPLPRRRSPAKAPTKSSGALTLVLCLLGVGILLVGGLAVGGVFLYLHLQNDKSLATAKEPIGAQGPVNGPNAEEINLKLDDWLQDLEEAKRIAAQEKKDILILFTDANEQNGWKQLADHVLAQSEFQKKILPQFVHVYIDMPVTQSARAKVLDPHRNIELHEKFSVSNCPVFILADSQGRPYAIKSGYNDKEAATYCSALEKLRETRTQRDQLVAKFEKSKGIDKLKAHQELLDFLKRDKLLPHYPELVKAGVIAAGQIDADNKEGFLEKYFQMEWNEETGAVSPDAGPERNEAMKKCVARMNDWKKTKRFKDPNRAAELYLKTASFLENLGTLDAAFDYVDEAIAYQPTTREIMEQIRFHLYRLGVGGGTSFVISKDGYLLTNHHVVNNTRHVRVRIPKAQRSAVVEVVASDPTADIALLKIKDLKGIDLKPLSLVAGRTVNRGEPVAVLGFPLLDMVGSGMKLTTGVISATPEAGNENKLVLDAKVNPGNSGGPLLDANGGVIGIVSAKSFGGFGPIESYGLAIPAPVVEDFLKKSLKDFQISEAPKEKIDWQELNRRASPSVFMVMSVIKNRPQVPNFMDPDN